MLKDLGLRLRFALFFAAMGAGGTALLAVGLWIGWSRAGGAIDGYVIAGLIGGFGIIGLATWIGLLFDENVARPILALAAELHTRAQSDVDVEIDGEAARYLGALAPAAQSIHAELEAARKSQAEAFAEKTALMARDKALLEALLRDLSDGVIVVSPTRHIILYNEAAVRMLGQIGLNRPIDNFLRMAPVEEALARRDRAPDAAAEPFLTVTRDDGRILTGAVSRVVAGEERVGDVVTLQDSTEALRTHADFEGLLRETIQEARRPAMAIGALLDVMEDGSDLTAEITARLTQALREEADRLSAHLAQVSTRQDALATMLWPVSDVDADEIAGALKARHPQLKVRESGERLRCDGFAITAMLDVILTRLAEDTGRSKFELSAERHGHEVLFRLGWDGPTIRQGILDDWLAAPLSDAYGPYTGKDTLDVHRTEMWVGKGPAVLLPLTVTGARVPATAARGRDFYDFNLPAGGGALAERPLAELAFVVFDTETTGLDPEADDVVQLAGVRMVGPRILRGEEFDRLVDPGRPIPAASTEIHGITGAMVAGAPRFDEIAGAFRSYAEDAVLVAHNARFDMAFLHRAGDFDHPVLCTGRLSAALFEHTGEHTLDVLAERFGIEIDESVRHTALGDALATAEVFRRMLSVLRDKGVKRLGDAIRLQGNLA